MLFVEDTGNCKAPPEQIGLMALKVGVVGLVTLMLTVVEHPVFAVYVIVLVPKLTAVTSPVLDTVAKAVLLEVHGLFAAAVPEPVSWEVVLGHKTVLPVTFGMGFTVTVTAFRVALTQGPPTPSI
jgi:hypothetical protein